MAIMNKELLQMSMPKALARGYVGPLDASSLYYSYEEMARYAAGLNEDGTANATSIAYVGQILSLVNEADNNKVTAYIIADEAGNLQEVGSATLGDNKTIVLDEANGSLGLKNWNVKYWRRGDKEAGEEEYVEQLVDETHSWKAGLQPRAYFNGSNYELAWYEPSTTTIEDVSNIVDDVQTQLQTITDVLGKEDDSPDAEKPSIHGILNGLEQETEDLAGALTELTETTLPAIDLTEGGDINGNLDITGDLGVTGGLTVSGDTTIEGTLYLSDGEEAASKVYVNEQIAGAGHLKRLIVDALPDVNAEGVDDNTIYMIKTEGLLDDKYVEYMRIDGTFEQIGDTSVDLTNYVQKVEGATANNLAALDANGALIDAGIALTDVSSHLADTTKHITADERIAWTTAVTTASDAKSAAEAAQGTADEAKEIAEGARDTLGNLGLADLTKEDFEKLSALPAITEIGGDLVLNDGVLSFEAEEYELPAATAESLGGVKVGTGLDITEDGVLSVLAVEENGLTIDENGIALALASANNAGAMSSASYTKLANLPDGIKLANSEVAADIVSGKYVLPFANETTPGLVVSTQTIDPDVDKDKTLYNKIHVATDGIMEVNILSVEKLVVPDDVEFILNGGGAA
mgnify:CR=1 FL=1